jgi:hypothetical protein
VQSSDQSRDRLADAIDSGSTVSITPNGDASSGKSSHQPPSQLSTTRSTASRAIEGSMLVLFGSERWFEVIKLSPKEFVNMDHHNVEIHHLGVG